MTLYTKPRAELFAQDAPSSEIKPFTAWLRGLGIAFDETNGFPEMESFNGLLQALNGYIKYLEQNGFAEWSSTLEYPQGAGVRVGAVWYRAKTQNLNKPPATSQNEWAVFLNASDLSFSDPLQVVDGVIGIKDATITQKGVTRFATATEVSNRTNVSAAITPANVGQTFSGGFSTNDGIRLPSGHIFKWGSFQYTSGVLSVNFPEAFPNACLSFGVSPGKNTTNAIEIFQYNNFSKTGFTGVAESASTYHYFAIGY